MATVYEGCVKFQKDVYMYIVYNIVYIIAGSYNW